MKFERSVEISSVDQGGQLRMVLKGELGAVHFLVLTNWAFTRPMAIDIGPIPDCLKKPLPSDLGYHSPKPMCVDDVPMEESCPYLDGKPCYYDGSGLAAQNVWEILLEKGSDGVWEFLEKYYQETFLEEKEAGI
jgi:hypothetical protein